ncbi:hypothetical protein GCM10010218_29550 [Streptomyces mashuensis]|uniref:Uncharacterized protein n=1 Tax=Streptomyces mashuensis TaxID=33904 RepID=A0A919B2R8_9ACTN|nr:hypothetical protein [Streptomyces mashuensis]GHF46378.1 hypothetical protein GCM10010218_29550 [Streptomyces mashuensis]
MTYREGAYVVDTRSAALGQVVGRDGADVQVREPGSGREWGVPPDALRLASHAERVAAGLRETAALLAPGSPVGCTECTDLEAARRAAVNRGGHDAIVDATVALRTHFRDAHILWRRPR